jgi:dihydroxy-acid dehydratase
VPSRPDTHSTRRPAIKKIWSPHDDARQQHLLEAGAGGTARRRFDPDRAAQTSAVVTIASAYTNAHRCNNRVRAITDLLVELLAERGGQGLIVGAPAVSDALTQGTPTAGYSLASRDTVADCFEIGHYAHHGDAMIVISGCDKTGAAALMPLARTNAFGLVLYPGTGTPGRVSFGAWASKGNNLTILDYAEARAANESGRLSARNFWKSSAT